MSMIVDMLPLRVRYSDTDQMGTFYNSRPLEWFECARTELIRSKMGMSYAELEAKGFYLPVVEAHLEFHSGARYDDLLEITSKASFSSRARLHFDMLVTHSGSGKVCVRGFTVHAFTNRQGRPVRPPEWFCELFEAAALRNTTPPAES